MAGLRSSHPPIAFAHRGGAGVEANRGIENSLAAFRHAYELGYRHLETDVHVSSDGVVHAFHDDTLERLTGDPTPLRELTAEELARPLLDGREPVPRLADLFTAFPDARFNIDVKADDAVEPTCALLRELDVVGRTRLAAFEHHRLVRIRRTLPEVATSSSSREVATVLALPAAVLRLGGRPGGDCVQVPPRRHGVPIVTGRFVDRCHALGLDVHVWTIDEPAEMHRLLDLGVDGLMTDRTDLLRDVLVARGEWRTPA